MQYISNTICALGVCRQCTLSYPVDMTTRGTPGRMIRIEDEMWELYGQLCAEEGTTRTDELRRHVHSRVRAYAKAKGIEAPKVKPRIVRKKPAADS
jgi:hypothetical protein